MLVRRQWVESYSRYLNEVCGRARTGLTDALMRIDYTQDAALVRETTTAVMQRYCGASATLAERLAAEFYDGLRAQSGISDGFRAAADSGREPGATDGAVRAFMDELADGKPPERFVERCAERLDYETRLAANRCVERNARRDPRKPRWARVPTGAETCSFCIMLASRGFAYHSEETASHAHANCDCRLVPGWDNLTAVEGYDVAYYKDVYAFPERHPEVREAINARRRERYAERSDSPSESR